MKKLRPLLHEFDYLLDQEQAELDGNEHKPLLPKAGAAYVLPLDNA